MPYANEHVAIIVDKSKFDEFRRKTDEFGAGIDVLYGHYKDKDSWAVHSIHFDSKKFTVDEAKKWLSDHKWKYIKFEPATGEKGFIVECGKCHHKFDLTKEPEVAMGATKCPNCDSTIDQEGNVLVEGTKNMFSRLIKRPFKNRRDEGA